MDRWAWWATVHRVAQSQTLLKQLSMHACNCMHATCEVVNILAKVTEPGKPTVHNLNPEQTKSILLLYSMLFPLLFAFLIQSYQKSYIFQIYLLTKQMLVSKVLPLFQIFWNFATKIILRKNFWTTQEYLFQYVTRILSLGSYPSLLSPLLFIISILRTQLISASHIAFST